MRRRIFRLEDAERRGTHQVHAYAAGVPDVIRHFAFREYMGDHPSIAVAYGDLKERLANENPRDMQAYIDGKDAFVKAHDKRAMVCAKTSGERDE